MDFLGTIRLWTSLGCHHQACCLCPGTALLTVRVLSPLGASGAALSRCSLTPSRFHPGYCPPAALLGSWELTAVHSALFNPSSLEAAASIEIEQQHCACIIHCLLLKNYSSSRLKKYIKGLDYADRYTQADCYKARCSQAYVPTGLKDYSYTSYHFFK